jgi:hypothetical protein
MAPVCDAILLNILFPHLAAVRIEQLSGLDGVVFHCPADRPQQPPALAGVESLFDLTNVVR